MVSAFLGLPLILVGVPFAMHSFLKCSRDSSDQHSRRIPVALFQQVLRHLQEVAKDVSVDQLPNRPKMPSCILGAQRPEDAGDGQNVSRPGLSREYACGMTMV